MKCCNCGNEIDSNLPLCDFCSKIPSIALNVSLDSKVGSIESDPIKLFYFDIKSFLKNYECLTKSDKEEIDNLLKELELCYNKITKYYYDIRESV